jgi:hypothetical protein
VNLFVTDEDPVACARALDDKRVGKLLMEANQMMSMAVKRHLDVSHSDVGEDKLVAGTAYSNHPVTIWVGENRSNFRWAYRHAVALAIEWRHRFNSSHASAKRTPFIYEFAGYIPKGELTPFQNSARNGVFNFTWLPVPLSYRHYLITRWKNDVLPVKFTNRQPPDWSKLS